MLFELGVEFLFGLCLQVLQAFLLVSNTFPGFFYLGFCLFYRFFGVSDQAFACAFHSAFQGGDFLFYCGYRV
ncbi:MAG: hypothetical protein CMN85_07975 [Spongiibacteraceae bacterium]|nr:hypothetical protein [Spongiibacteraceae bacterium]